MQFDGSAIDGFSRIQESDVLARPTPAPFELLPWTERDETVGPHVLRHHHARRHAVRGRPPPGAAPQPRRRPRPGYSFFVAPEMEFFYFASRRPVAAAAAARHRRLLRPHHGRRQLGPPARRTIHHLEAMGIPVEYSFHEDSPSQHEIDLRYTDALSHGRQRHDVPPGRARDRHGAGRVRHVHAEADDRRAGLGHAHPPVAVRGRRQRVPRPDRAYPLSKTGQAFIAGLLHHAAEITAVTNQLVNSYKRLIVGTEAPVAHHLGAEPPVRAGPGPDARSRARSPRSASSTARPTRPATRTSPSR